MVLIRYLRRRSRPPAFCLRTNSTASSDTWGVHSGGWPQSTGASSFPHLQTIAHGPPGFSKGYQDCRHKAERLALLLTKLAKDTEGRLSRKARSRPKVVGFDSSLRHTPGVFPLAKRSLPKIGGRRSRTVRCHGLFTRKLVFQFGVAAVDLLWRPSSSRFPRSRQDLAGRSSPRGSQK